MYISTKKSTPNFTDMAGKLRCMKRKKKEISFTIHKLSLKHAQQEWDEKRPVWDKYYLVGETFGLSSQGAQDAFLSSVSILLL